MCVESKSFALTASTYIALNALEILQLVLTASTYIAFDVMAGKSSVSAFQNFFELKIGYILRKL